MGELAVGVMGGTFDPIHFGHLVAASEVAHRLRLDEVVFVPAGSPWQKGDPAPAEDRYLMTVIATAPDARFKVSRVDIDRHGPTYTIDTLSDLQASYAGATRLHLIAGADTLASILTWRDPEAVLAMAHVVGVSRPGHELAHTSLPTGAVTMLRIPSLDISSTDIRARIRSGRPIDYLLPAGVAAYLGKRGLYQGPTA